MVETVTVRVNDPLVRLRTPQSARVTIEIQPVPVTRVLTGVRVIPRNSSSRTAPTIVPALVTVAVRGQSSVVDALTSSVLTAVADVTDLRQGQHILQVQVEAPPGAEVVAVTPARVRVRIR